MPSITKKESIEVAKLHLDRLWQEIFWRRETEQKVCVWTIGSFAAVLALAYGRDKGLTFEQKWLFSALPLVLGPLSAWYLLLNAKKNKAIARVIVKLNSSLGAWEKGHLIDDKEDSLFPDSWSNWGKLTLKDERVSFFYILLVLLTSVYALVGLFLR